MDKDIKNYLGITAIIAIILTLIASFWYVNVYSRSVAPQRTFTVSGEDKAVAVPDVAELIFGVLTEGGKNIDELQRENAEKINQIITFLKEAGIDEKDVKTQYYNISPRYQYYSCPTPRDGSPIPCPPSKIIGYSINQGLLVKIRDLGKTGEIIAGAVDRGATNISGPTFTIDDPTELQNQVREEAMKKAKAKAEAIAQSAGFRLGKLISVNEGFSLPPIYYRGFEQSIGYGMGGDAPIIEPGSQEIRVSVNLTYEIR